jgi:hypothetical protein
MTGQSLYELLGVQPTAPTESIKNAYRTLAKRYHPDTHPGHPEYEELLKEITAAYAVLRNPVRRAAYDLGTASNVDDAQDEPKDEWEPSPEELRDIYALDEQERAKEIERLCALHPYLRQFFEDRPPPPRFMPSDAYISAFRQHGREWRLEEIERQCARHPHLRQWFVDLEAQCERAEEERARTIEHERARTAQYEKERALLATIAFASLGGAVALFVAFVPVWIVAGVVGVFSGGWSGDVERNQAAFQSEAGWFWFLWIVCGLAGAAFLGLGQLTERWLESPSNDLTWTRVKGFLIAVPCIVAIITMISMRAEDMSRTADSLAARVQLARTRTQQPIQGTQNTPPTTTVFSGVASRPVTICNIPNTYHEFKPTRERLNPDPTRCMCSYFHQGTLRVWQLGAPETKWYDVAWHENTNEYDPMPWNVEYVAAAGTSFGGYYTCQ